MLVQPLPTTHFLLPSLSSLSPYPYCQGCSPVLKGDESGPSVVCVFAEERMMQSARDERLA